MINNGARVAATFIIWLTLAIIMTSNDGAAVNNNWALIVIFATALLSTIAVWLAGNIGDHNPSSQKSQFVERPLQKAKRSDLSRVDRLLDALDHDEAQQLLDELQARLEPADGESLSLDDLLSEREAARQSRHG